MMKAVSLLSALESQILQTSSMSFLLKILPKLWDIK